MTLSRSPRTLGEEFHLPATPGLRRRLALAVVALPFALLPAIACALFLAAPPAFAAFSNHQLSSTFGSETSTVTDPYPLSNPTDVAVDSSGGPSNGDVYVNDPGNLSVEKFDSSGELLSIWGAGVVATGPDKVPLNEQQAVTLGASVTGGTFTLGFESESTASIPHNATANEVKAALEALSSIGSGAVAVTGPTGGPWTVEFTGPLADTNVAELTVDSAELSGGSQTAEITTTIEGAAATNEQQAVTLGASVTGGTFTLGFESESTASIPHNATANEVKAALEALSSIGSGAVAVTGPTGGPWTVEFTGPLADTNVAELTVDSAELSGGSQTATTATNTQGASAYEVCTPSNGDACQPGTSSTAPGSFTSPAFLAVDDSPGGEGDVYVADKGDGTVSKFTPEGALVTGWGTNGQTNGSTVTNGPFGSIAGIAIDTAGVLYVMNRQERVFKFDQQGKFSGDFHTPDELEPSASGIAVDGAGNLYFVLAAGYPLVEKINPTGEDIGSVEDNPVASGLAVDPLTSEIYVDISGGEIDRYESCNPSGGAFANTCTPTESFGGGSLNGATGIAVDATSDEAVYVANTGSGDVAAFPRPVLPNVTLSSAFDITASGATLGAEMELAGGGPITECSFEYLTDSEFKSQGWKDARQAQCESSPPYGGPGPVQVAAKLSRLAPGTLYHYRILVSNADGIPNIAEGHTFTTDSRYQFSTDLGTPGSGDGQLEKPEAVAVDDATGDLYVADTGNRRIDQLSSSGAFIRAFGASVGGTGVNICTSACVKGASGSEPGQFEVPRFIAVDNSDGPSAGDVYVGDTGDHLVQKFDSEGHPITSWEDGGTREYPGGIAGIAIRSDGQLIVQSGSGSGIAVDEFGTIYPGSVAIDPATSFLYTDTGSEIERSTSLSYCNSLGGRCSVLPACRSTGAEDCPVTEFFGAGDLNEAAGLAFDPSNETILAANSGAGDIVVFAPLPLPKVVTGPIESPTPSSAVLTGTVDPSGTEVAECKFEYGETEEYGSTVSCETGSNQSIGDGTNPVTVHATVSSLQPSAAYHYRLVAVDSGGQGLPRYGSDRAFLAGPDLSPAVDVTSTSTVTSTTTTVNAQINPEFAPTSYRIEYGTSAAFGLKTAPSESIGRDGIDHAVSSELVGLTPGTTYYFRIVAINPTGPTDGPIKTFNTPSLPSISETSASSIGVTSVTLSARITPGFRSTTYAFQYGTTSLYGEKTSESVSIGSDNSPHTASTLLTGLLPGTTYHFSVSATNEIGFVEGSDQTFMTAPVVEGRIGPALSKCPKRFVRKHGRCVKKARLKRHRAQTTHKGGGET